MKWNSEKLRTPPLWARLRYVSNSSAAKSTILVPLVGYLIIFNENVVRFLNMAHELGGRGDATVSHRLILIYLGLCAVSVGALVYGWLCPNEIKHYGTAAAFIQGDGPGLRGFVLADIQEEVSADEASLAKLKVLSDELRQKELQGLLTDNDMERFRIENLQLYFDY
jgi:hypothetical protein